MRWLRDPLVHFVVLGAALFGLVTFIDGDHRRSPDEIVVTTGQIASLQAIFAKTWQRPPTPPETEKLVAEYVRDEIVHREALVMGLDRDDAIIRRRLRQKFEFVTNVASESEPTETEIQAFVVSHPDWFRDEARISFTHVFFSGDDALSKDTARLQRLRQALQEGSAKETDLGNAFLPGFDFESLPHSDAAKIFGEEFAAALDKIAPGKWEGPIASSYGAHLVRVSVRTEATSLPTARIHEIARRQLMSERRIAAAEALYAKLRERYVVTVEPAPKRLAQASQ